MNIDKAFFEKIKTGLGLNTVSPELSQAILNRFGNDILTNVVQKFLETQGEWEQGAFESWIEAHQNDADMLEQLMILYPDFGRTLVSEILIFQSTFQENKN